MIKHQMYWHSEIYNWQSDGLHHDPSKLHNRRNNDE